MTIDLSTFSRRPSCQQPHGAYAHCGTWAYPWSFWYLHGQLRWSAESHWCTQEAYQIEIDPFLLAFHVQEPCRNTWSKSGTWKAFTVQTEPNFLLLLSPIHRCFLQPLRSNWKFYTWFLFAIFTMTDNWRWLFSFNLQECHVFKIGEYLWDSVYVALSWRLWVTCSFAIPGIIFRTVEQQ